MRPLVDSMREYASALGYWSVIVIASAALTVLGLFQIATGRAGGALPGWVLVSISFVVVLIIPFIAFHRMRLTVVAITSERRLALKRMVVELKHATQNLAAKWEIAAARSAQGSVSFEDERLAYDVAMKKLRIEADIEGGDAKKILNDFLQFIASETWNFVGEKHSDPMAAGIFKGTDDDVPDSFHFMAQLQEQTDAVIEALSQ